MTFFPLTENTYWAGVCVIVPMAQIWVPESCRFYHPGPDCASAPLMGHWARLSVRQATVVLPAKDGK